MLNIPDPGSPKSNFKGSIRDISIRFIFSFFFLSEFCQVQLSAAWTPKTRRGPIGRAKRIYRWRETVNLALVYYTMCTAYVLCILELKPTEQTNREGNMKCAR